MRAWLWSLWITTSVAQADNTIRVRRLTETEREPLLHLDVIAPVAAGAEGGLVARRRAALAIGPRARIAAEGTWWQSGLSPSLFAEDLRVRGQRIAGELSYDVGPFHVGLNAAIDREGTSSHRIVGLFVSRNFALSRWMHAWIALGVAYEQWDVGTPHQREGPTIGLTFGTTFR